MPSWKWNGVDAQYPFEVIPIYCDLVSLSQGLGIKLSKLKKWEDDGDIPSRSQTPMPGMTHNNFYTEDEVKEAFVKATWLQRKEG